MATNEKEQDWVGLGVLIVKCFALATVKIGKWVYRNLVWGRLWKD